MARILICEDDPAFRELAMAALNADGHEVKAVATGPQAVAALRANGYDLVLTDIVMPDMDGLELIRSVRASQPGVVILAMSSGLPGLRDQLLRAAEGLGAAEIIAKPFAPAALRAKVAELLARPRR
jgi:DNA-binding response OmpR family regulator